MLVDEQYVVFETGVEVWLETQMDNHGIMVAVDMCVDSVQSLENLSNGLTEILGERGACESMGLSSDLPVPGGTAVRSTYQCGLERFARCRCCLVPSSSSARRTLVQAFWLAA